MIVIEGSDLVGKTTFAEKIINANPKMKYNHFSRHGADFDYFWDYVDWITPKNLMDRFIMSEPVYRKANGESNTKLDPIALTALQRSMIHSACITVVITAEDSLLEERMREGEMFSKEVILAANRIFYEIVENNCVLQFADKTFQFHVDHWIHLHEGKPFPTTSDLETVLAIHDLFCAQQAYLKATNGVPYPKKA